MANDIELRLIDARAPDGDDPAAPYLDNSAVPLDEILASAPGPDADGGIDLTEEEFTAFLRAARS